MPQLESRTTRDIQRDAGAPQKLSNDEQCAGAGMDDVDRSDWPEGEDVSAAETPVSRKEGYSGLQGRKSGQLGTT